MKDGSTTMLRVEFDDLAKSWTGWSLNASFLIGPTYHDKLTDIHFA